MNSFDLIRVLRSLEKGLNEAETMDQVQPILHGLTDLIVELKEDQQKLINFRKGRVLEDERRLAE